MIKIKKYIFEHQDDLKDCGATCLSMIIKYYGGYAPREMLRDLTKTTKDGTNFYNIIKASNYFNLNTYGTNCNIDCLNNNNLPCIAHVVINKSFKHFIVVFEINHDKKYLIVGDPSKNRITKISFSEFNNISTSNYLISYPRTKVLKIKKKNELRNLFLNIIKDNWLILLLISVLSFIFSLLSIFSSYYFEIVINATNSESQNIICLLLYVFLFVSIFKNFINYIRLKLLVKFNFKMDFKMNSFIYNKIMSLSYIYFKNRTTGEVLSRINDISEVKSILNNIITSLFIDILFIIIPFIFLMFISFKLSIILLFIMLLYLVTVLLFKNKIKNYIRELKEDNALINSYLVESIHSLETVRTLNIKKYITNKFNNIYNKFIKKNIKYNGLLIKQNIITSLLSDLFLIITLIYGLILISNNVLSIEKIITFYLLSNIIINSFLEIISFFYNYIDTKQSFKRINELCETECVELNNGKYISDFSISNIKVKKLNYSYNGRDYILQNINININKKDRVLIKGNSGKGKSTLMKIISGLLDDYYGQVLINDINIKNLSKSDLFNQITYVSQNDMLYTMSIKDNIMITNGGGDYNTILENTYVNEIFKRREICDDYLIEEDAFNLSCGEKQRIIIARSLMKNSEIYIFDEALCNMDVLLERQVLINLFNEYKDKTFIVISHRFNNEDLFNKIIDF